MKWCRCRSIFVSLFLSVSFFVMLWQLTNYSSMATSVQTGLNVTGGSELIVEKRSHDHLVADGEPITYTLFVTNSGSSPVTTTVIDHLPEQVTATGTSRSLVWPLVNLGPGMAWSEEVVVTVTEGYTGPVVNRVEVSDQWGQNLSLCTECAEEDNVNVPLYGYNVLSYFITATHPAYLASVPWIETECADDFSGCARPADADGVSGDPCLVGPAWYDDGIDVIRVCEEVGWWRPGQEMNITVNGGPVTTGQRIVWSRRVVSGTDNTYPQFFVLYEDGNLRLKPNPPEGRLDTCFGSSIIVGPAAAVVVDEPDVRPFAAIDQVDIDVPNKVMTLTYEAGGQAVLYVDVNRQHATVLVEVDYDTSVPFATFRSMYVDEGNNDNALLKTSTGTYSLVPKDLGNGVNQWEALTGNWWYFYRQDTSQHNISSPDFTIASLETAVVKSSNFVCSNACEIFLPNIQR